MLDPGSGPSFLLGHLPFLWDFFPFGALGHVAC